MSKHMPAADEVMKNKLFKHLGRFRNRKILEQGHNATDPGEGMAACLAKCEKMSIIRKRTCEVNCAIAN